MAHIPPGHMSQEPTPLAVSPDLSSIPSAEVEMASITIPGEVLAKQVDAIPLEVGEGDWVRSVGYCDENKIVVKNNDFWLLLLSIGGVLALIGVVAGAVWFVPSMFDANVPRIKKIQAAGGIAALLVAGIVGVCMFPRIGRWIVLSASDKEAREETPRQLINTIQPARAVVQYAEPDNDGDQFIEVSVAGAGEGEELTLATTLTVQPSASLFLRLAARIAALLRIPLEIRGELVKGHDDLKAWHGRILAMNADTSVPLATVEAEGEEQAHQPVIAVPGYTYGVIAAVLVSIATSFFFLSSTKWLVWIVSQGVGLMLLFTGINAVRTRRAEGKKGQVYEGNKALLVGYGQIAGGIIAMVGLPIAIILGPEPGEKNVRPQRWGMVTPSDRRPSV